jgi:hypothetical protein
VGPESADGCEEWLRSRLGAADHLEGERPLAQYLRSAAREGVVGETLAALQGRSLRPHPSCSASP